jgi:hypothetical protein
MGDRFRHDDQGYVSVGDVAFHEKQLVEFLRGRKSTSPMALTNCKDAIEALGALEYRIGMLEADVRSLRKEGEPLPGDHYNLDEQLQLERRAEVARHTSTSLRKQLTKKCVRSH